jgi:dipeptidyl aminopeptidase/acylaminoacyl peptidase
MRSRMSSLATACLAATCVCFWMAGPGAAHATEGGAKLLATDTFFEMESLGSPAISSDGSQIIFSRSRIDKVNDRSGSNLWIVDVEGKRLRELTHGNWRDSSPIWSPDGKRIAFLSDRDGTTQVHILWPDTREVAQLTHLENAPRGIRWSPDGKQLAFSLFIPDTSPILAIDMPLKPKGAQWAAPAVLIDRISWQNDGRGFIPRGCEQIFVLDAELGGTPRQVTSGPNLHYPMQQSPRHPVQAEWSADGRTIFFSAVRKPDIDYMNGDSEVYAVELETLEISTLTDRFGPDRSALASPDGKWLVYQGFDEKRKSHTYLNLYLMDTQGEQKRLLAGGLLNTPSDVTWDRSSSGIYYLMSEKGTSNLYFVSLEGKIRKITDGNHTLSRLSLAQNGRVATRFSDPHTPGMLATFTLEEPSPIQKLVDVNDDVLNGVILGQVEELWFKSPDGLDLQGWLIRPAEFDPSREYPLILWIHGGPQMMYSVGFDWSFQNFAALGYAVFYMNPRGSTGYGQDFVDGIQYAYPGKDYDDLMAGVDTVIAKGFIDTDNLFVCGSSGGGCLTAWIVGHTDRFRAAVAMAPVINWYSFVGTTDGYHFHRGFREYPWEDPLSYAVRSPLHYVANVKTPTMVMTGENDLRCRISQSEEYFRALRINKVDSVLVRMPDEYHGFRRPTHRLMRQLYLRAWFEKHALKH